MRFNYRHLRIPLAVTGVLILLFSLVAQAVLGYTVPHNQPGPAADKLIFKAFHQDIAKDSLLRGDMDIYIYGLKVEAAQQLAGDPNAALYQAPATSISLLLNPADAPSGQLNPFSIKEVRFALNYVINRDFITQEFYRGMALPMVAHVGATDYDYRIVQPLIREKNISYQPELAKQVVNTAMTGAGAQLVDNQWYYQGKRIDLTFIVRTEDERRQIGDAIKNELNNLGFSVIIKYQQFAVATNTVYGNDPKLFEWHLYTEGWGRGTAQRYDYSLINQMYAPWLGNMPGYLETGWWQYENAELDELGQQIFKGEVADKDERDTLYEEMTELGLNEAVRLWIATVINSFPANTTLDGVTEDITSGPRGQLTLREAYVPGQDTLTIGSQWVWTARSTWNPVGGFGDIYSNDIYAAVYDPAIISDPFTGNPVPFRSGFEVTTAGPNGTLSVPADAFMWNAESGEFQSVGNGVQAVSKVTLDYSEYFDSKWHDGQPITIADVIFGIYQSFDMVYNDDKANIEFAIATTSKPLLETYKGFRIIDGNTLEVYVDFWHFETDYIASYAVPTSLATPWEVLAAMDELVFIKRQAAYSDTAAARFSIPWLSLVQDADARKVKNILNDFSDDNYVPLEALTIDGVPLVSLAEAKARYQAAADWFDRYGLLIIGNGPFMLTDFDAAAQYAELVANRDPSYPFRPGDWYFGSSEGLEVADVSGTSITKGEEATIDITLSGPGMLGADFLLYDPSANAIVKSGQANKSSNTGFSVSLTSSETTSLDADVYYLYVLANSDSISTLAERRVDIEVGSGGGGGNGGGGGGNGGGDDDGGGTSATVIIIPLVLLAAAGVAYFIIKGGRKS